MKILNSNRSIDTRFLLEITSSGFLAFVIVSLVFSVTSPAPMSLSYFMSVV